MHHEITTRIVHTEDVDEVQSFLFQTIKSLFNMDRHPVYHKDVIDLAGFYVEDKDHILIAAYENDQVVGTIGVKSFIDRFEDIQGMYDGKKVCELARCYIHVEKRRKGIGSVLFNDLIREAKKMGYDILYLHTHRSLPGGLSFWLKNGFEIIFDSDKEDIVHMELSIE